MFGGGGGQEHLFEMSRTNRMCVCVCVSVCLSVCVTVRAP